MASSKTRVRVVSNRAVVVEAVRRAMKAKVYAMGKSVEKHLKTQVLSGARTGRWYRVPGTNRMYRASKPGEAPATRLGDLKRSYRTGPLREEPGRISVQVGSPLKYAPILEDEASLNRPHLEPAVKLAEPEIAQVLRGDWGI